MVVLFLYLSQIPFFFISIIFGLVQRSVLLSQRESFVTVKIFDSKILMNFDVFEVPESELKVSERFRKV